MTNMNPKKFLKRVASLGMALLLLVGVTAPVKAASLPAGVVTDQSADNVKVTLTAELELTGDKTTDDEEFNFILVPDDESSPMPKSDTGETVNTATVKGAGMVVFGPITYTERGKYTYTLYQEPGENEQYTYDDTQYEIKVTVDRSSSVYYAFYTCHKVEEPEETDPGAAVDTTEAPEASQAPDTEDGQEAESAKVDVMLFSNEYTEPVVPYNPPSTPTSPKPETSPEPSEDVEPSPEPSEDVEPSPEPSEEPAPEPSEEPSPEPSEVVEPSPEPSEEVSPSPSAVTETAPKPSSGTGSSVTPGTTPKTGDETDNSLWITMICVAAAGLVAGMCYLLVPRKRRHR